MQECRRGSQQAEAQESQRGSQQAEVQESRRGSQQVEVQESRRGSQQAEVQESRRGSQQAEVEVSQRGSQQVEVQESRRGSQQAEAQESQKGSQQAEVQESRRGSQQVEVPESQKECQEEWVPYSRQDSLRQAAPYLHQSPQQAETLESQQGSKFDTEQDSQQDSQLRPDFPYSNMLWSTLGGEVLQPSKSESKSTLGSQSSIYVEAEDQALQTYSIITLEDGIWINRKTGRLLTSHHQQTSVTSFHPVNGTALEGYGDAVGESKPPQSDEEQPRGKSGQESQHGSQSAQSYAPSITNAQCHGELKCTEDSVKDVEKVLNNSHMSENTLLSLQSSLTYAEVEYDSLKIYSNVAMPAGSWVNIKTGKLLASQNQQTDESSFNKLEEDGQAVHHSSSLLEKSQHDLTDK
ncbi:hypothetical protein JD844_020259 [Phrynosoma platyrhinos]|uniref:Uncharacterized protein n=1 Tax=Phrynosoma platyrhinos TaxID=52577 RepID=A0ABQ7SS81_PHRPL|nr:hypothetical protein JD844_020259 [Phrynosoma platyrhinos]